MGPARSPCRVRTHAEAARCRWARLSPRSRGRDVRDWPAAVSHACMHACMQHPLDRTRQRCLENMQTSASEYGSEAAAGGDTVVKQFLNHPDVQWSSWMSSGCPQAASRTITCSRVAATKRPEANGKHLSRGSGRRYRVLHGKALKQTARQGGFAHLDGDDNEADRGHPEPRHCVVDADVLAEVPCEAHADQQRRHHRRVDPHLHTPRRRQPRSTPAAAGNAGRHTHANIRCPPHHTGKRGTVYRSVDVPSGYG